MPRNPVGKKPGFKQRKYKSKRKAPRKCHWGSKLLGGKLLSSDGRRRGGIIFLTPGGVPGNEKQRFIKGCRSICRSQPCA